MLKISLNGVLGGDAEVREVGKQKAINFNVAVHKEYKNGSGEKVEKTEWVKAVMWRSSERSTKIAEYLKKGTKVLIDGEPSAEAFIGKDDKAIGSLSVNVKELEFLH